MSILAHQTDRHSHQLTDVVIEVDIEQRDHLDTLKQLHRTYYLRRLEADRKVNAAAQDLAELRIEAERLRTISGSIGAAIDQLDTGGTVTNEDLYGDWVA